jgi:hypothetical protein
MQKMNNIATPCALCGEPIEGEPKAMSLIAGGLVCLPCGECCRDAEIQSRYYGKKAGISGTMTIEQYQQIRK